MDEQSQFDAPPMFGGLPPGPSPRQRLKALGSSFGIEATILTLLMLIPAARAPIVRLVSPQPVLLYEPPKPVPPPVRHVVHVPPPVERPVPRPVTIFKPVTVVVPHRVRVVTPKPVRLPSAPLAKLEAKPIPLPVVKAPPAPVKLNSFATKEAVTTNRPAAQVQTGGFGSNAGVQGKAHGPTNVAHLGGFDMPTGAGQGNGTGGAHGARGVVASGFGSGSGGGGNGTGGTGGPGVEVGGFGAAAAAATPAARASAPVESTPVDILYKPDPQYSPEARRDHIQGEVLLRVSFLANGQVEVGDLVRGLGHGLDQQAIAVARAIRFKPATRGGQPITTQAVLHVTFQLAD